MLLYFTDGDEHVDTANRTCRDWLSDVRHVYRVSSGLLDAAVMVDTGAEDNSLVPR